MNVTYGCECTECQVHEKIDPVKAPVIGEFKRGDIKLKLCTRCILYSVDVLVKPLVSDETDMKPVFFYDPVCIGCAYLQKNEQIQDLTRKNASLVIKSMKSEMDEMGITFKDLKDMSDNG